MEKKLPRPREVPAFSAPVAPRGWVRTLVSFLSDWDGKGFGTRFISFSNRIGKGKVSVSNPDGNERKRESGSGSGSKGNRIPFESHSKRKRRWRRHERIDEAIATAMPSELSTWDVATVLLYFVVLLGVAYWVSDKKHVDGTRNQGEGREEETEGGDGYFLAHHSVSWWAVAASLFASNIGAEHFVGLAGTAARSGVAVGFYEWGAMLCLLLLGYFYLPVYNLAGVSTTPEYLKGRYNDQCKMALVWVSLLLYLFTKVSATLYAGQVLLEQVTQVNKWAAAVLLILGTTLYTMMGGLTAVIYTEALQTIVLLAGGFMLFGCCMVQIGGMHGLESRASIVSGEFTHIFRSAKDPEFPWTGFVFGYYWVALWYWCCDQVIVQRAIAAKSISHGRLGSVWGGLLKVVPGFIIVVPGMVARVLMQEEGIVNNQTDKQEYDRAFGWMVMNVVPINLRGVLIAGMISALMSSLASVFNSSSTLFTLDVYRRWKPHCQEKELIWVGRASVAALAGFSLLWLPVIPMLGEQLFLYIQKPPAYVAPPILAVYTWGMITNYVNETGATVALWAGIALGALRFFFEILQEAALAPNTYVPFLSAFVDIHFLHFAAINFLFSTALLFAWSWIPGEEEVSQTHENNLFRRDIMETLHEREDTAHLHVLDSLEDKGSEVEMCDSVEELCSESGEAGLSAIPLDEVRNEDTVRLLKRGEFSNRGGASLEDEEGSSSTFSPQDWQQFSLQNKNDRDGNPALRPYPVGSAMRDWFTKMRRSDYLALDLATHASSVALVGLFVFVMAYFQ